MYHDSRENSLHCRPLRTKRELITEMADKIWEYAELSLQEFKSAALYCEALEREGFQVERGTSGY